MIAALFAAAIVTFLTLALATKVICGKERLIFYHHQLAVFTVSAALLSMWHEPLFRYLDLVAIGLATFLIFGRAGCLMAGCCHGRPHRWGVCYRDEHAGCVAPYYVGAKLFPVQAVESLWSLVVVVFGCRLMIEGGPPGAAFGSTVVLGGIGRFCLEFARGDPERPYFGGFSEAQWTSMVELGLIAGAERFGLLPSANWHLALAAAMLTLMIAIATVGWFRTDDLAHIRHPHHVREVAASLELLEKLAPQRSGDASVIDIGETSLGIRISRGSVREGGRDILHYTLSRPERLLRAREARSLARLIHELERRHGETRLLAARQGIYHVLFDDCPASRRSIVETRPAAQGKPSFARSPLEMDRAS